MKTCLNATIFALGKQYIMNLYSQTENLREQDTTMVYFSPFAYWKSNLKGIKVKRIPYQCNVIKRHSQMQYSTFNKFKLLLFSQS